MSHGLFTKNLAVSLLRLIAATLIALWSLTALASESSPPDFSNRVVLTDDQGEYPLGRHLLILEDPTKELTIEDVRKPEYAKKFVPSTKDTPGYGFSPSAYWVKVNIDRQTTQEAQWLLEFGYAPMQWIDVYTVNSDGELMILHSGSAVPYSKRPYKYHKHVFALSAEAHQITELYVRVAGESSKIIPIILYRADVFAKSAAQEVATLGIYAGIMIALICYNAFISITLRELTYFYYVAFLCFSLSCILILNGILQPLFAPESTTFGLSAIPYLAALNSLFALLFTARFLDIQTNFPTLHRVILALIAWSCIGIIISSATSFLYAITSNIILAATCAFTGIASGIYAVAKGNKNARFYVLAWFIFCVGVILLVLNVFGFIPTNRFTDNTFMLGSAVEAILLSIALAARMRSMKEEKERAQLEQLKTQEALNISQAETVSAQQESLNNKQIALDTIQKYSIKLEAEVKARTTELIATQQKLVASEKMAALGVFTAGMAHEINNPANFVAAGAQNAEYEVQKLQVFVGELLDDDADPDIKGEFNSRFTKIAGAHEVIKTGIKRIENVVKQLRTDHPEGDVGMQPTDVVATLESAWQVFSPTLKIPIPLTQYLEYRPTLECAVAEVQQVFIALLSNAAHAIEDAKTSRGDGYEGEITLKSEQANGHLLITISDNGAGIPTENLEKIFDPFFTTKVVGRGAGLGLSMARDVVKKHHGTLEVKSVIGEGTTFALRLPLTQPA